ncbi:protein translocase subunit SecF [Pseudoleptotrichia goodfellowii]|uniref:Protein-export membrane protein SecF n=1 Tax=Pseudoleptotrichia goodfellowii F0264 TaxID=596323 RepID=D0GKX4_9FUSO|nr:protein translocase subunit SecF [Pseudoleptotrichia goodfellowii]EEY35249.1 export membrane protein SecF [Pseudoleptotrichia goodfellowii F0264]MBF4806822.1 protein translocase subunit SecF [Pseudoleptotrichia goodfellowii]
MNLRVIQLKKYYLGFSAIMVLISIIFFLTIKLNLGVDFKGGDLLQLHYSQAVNKDTLNGALDGIINEVPQLKNRRLQYSEDNTIVLRTEQLTDAQKNAVLKQLTEKTGKYELVKYDTVGPTIGKELTSNALTALLIGSLLIIIYITIRFEFVYAVAGVAAVLHDVIIAMGLIAFLKYEINTPFIAAILTILGYSMNDTIVVFDRIRENDAKEGKTKDFAEIIEESVNQVYMRSLFTSLTTLLSITVLLIFGGDSLRTFNTALFIGMIFGTYSSIFVASPLVYLMRKYRKKRKDTDHKDKSKKYRQKTVNGYDEDEKVLV